MISIIIPVFNVEKELQRCLNSIINQSFYDLEIILVDDESPDNCPKICDYYAKQDRRIKVIHKKHGGLSDARNFGLKEANGEYVLFIDSDDEISLNACEKFNKYMQKNVDIIVGEALEIINDTFNGMFHTNLINGKIYSAQEYVTLSIKAMEWYAPSCFNAYRRKFLLENNLFFVKNLLHEDMEYVSRVFFKANKILYLQGVFYYYYRRENSITNAGTAEKNGKHLIYVYNLWMLRFDKVKDKSYKKLLFGALIKSYLHTCCIYRLETKHQRLVNGLNIKFVLKYSLNFKEKIKGMMFCVFPKIYIFLFHKYANINRS